MIPNQWYAIAESSEIKAGDMKGMRRMGQDLVLWRNSAGELSCMLDLCPHRGAALSGGKVLGDCIECPFHGFQYDVQGQGQFIPANGKNAPVPKVFRVQTFVVQEAQGFVWFWNGEPRDEYPPVPWFEDLDDSFEYGSIAVKWDSHYTRSIENQLDVSHLPFVHKNSIGRGNRTLVNGPYVTLENDTIQVWVDNRVDDGTPPTKPTKMPEPKRPALLTFKFPNMWQNRLADGFRIVAAFAPIDDDATMVYVRSYQRVKHKNAFTKLMATVTTNANRFVLREDQKVVETQRPKIAGLDIGERFIPGDRPIALFLIHRRDLILAAQEGKDVGDGRESIAQADAEIDWSMTHEGDIRPSLPYDLIRRRDQQQRAGQASQN
ncbi:MAG: aromatic ring-hydroxylating dioxygenase subunit alpha [Caldilineaceae bacterium]